MKFVEVDDLDLVNPLRTQLYSRLKNPVDGMWENLYIAQSTHYLVKMDDDTAGYFCVDSDKSLLQIFLVDKYINIFEDVISKLISYKIVKSASLSAIDPNSFNICLLYSQSIEPNTYLFEYLDPEFSIDYSLDIEIATEKDIPEIINFMKEQIYFDDTFGYTKNLVEREEFYMIHKGDTLIAISEIRLSDTQTEYADLGVVLSKDYRGKGKATKILYQQAQRAIKLGRKPICSTTFNNTGSKKAIEKAGFYISNIIFDLKF